MPILSNPRHERFAQLLAQGKSAEDAHELAGFARNRGNAGTLRNKKDIQSRVSELLEKRDTVDAQATERAIAKLAITKETVLGELAKIGFANMQDYMKVGPDGSPTLNFKDLTREQAAALIEITVEEFRDGRTDAREVRRVKFKLADKRSALVDLGKHLGLFIERHEIGEPGEFARMSDAELNAKLLEQGEKLGLSPKALAHLVTLQGGQTEH